MDKIEIVFVEEESDGLVANLTHYKDGEYKVLGYTIGKKWGVESFER